MWCSCHWGLDPSVLFARMREATAADLEKFSQHDIAATSWTFAMLSFSDTHILDLLAREASGRLPIAGTHLLTACLAGDPIMSRDDVCTAECMDVFKPFFC